MSPIRKELATGYLIRYVRTTTMESIVEFVYTSKCDVNQKNLAELLTTAEYFCLFPLIDYCSAFILSILSMKNCVSLMCLTRCDIIEIFLNGILIMFKFLFFFFARKFLYKHEIQRKIREYILSNFLEIAATNIEMLHLSCEDVLDIISDDALNTRSEEPIWDFCLRWIEFDENTRRRNVPKLLGAVRLGLLSQHVKCFNSVIHFQGKQFEIF